MFARPGAEKESEEPEKVWGAGRGVDQSDSTPTRLRLLQPASPIDLWPVPQTLNARFS